MAPLLVGVVLSASSVISGIPGRGGQASPRLARPAIAREACADVTETDLALELEAGLSPGVRIDALFAVEMRRDVRAVAARLIEPYYVAAPVWLVSRQTVLSGNRAAARVSRWTPAPAQLLVENRIAIARARACLG